MARPLTDQLSRWFLPRNLKRQRAEGGFQKQARPRAIPILSRERHRALSCSHPRLFFDERLLSLLLETPSANLPQIIRHINGAYTTYFNSKRARSGHLFQGRYKAILVDKDAYAKELSRYIHLNPVRAHMVKPPGGHP